ncbi:hypothetical protein B0H17DRAFT_1134761 [Mycena rosella]|uniref:CxC2-like cysteine cluster KDZ transposase-associated domain-containing protein n=1 Tax=Mycena rosella TaxID=1033263 RepID=A0AAD7DFD1_MYCRO|nr:hypothetical protein B0H17DRAFT_1134761 [Mycena rosella]
MVQSDEFTTLCLVSQGLIPSALWTPKLAIATWVLELYWVARLHCPTLSVQNWVKTLSDIQSRPFKPYQMQQFTICFDLYLEILQNVDGRVNKVLGRDTPDWRLKNGCPSCTYKLEGEAKLIFGMLAAMDGNDSLKHVLRKEQGAFDDNGVPKRRGLERPDPRTADVGGDYFLTHEKVDKWSKEMLAQQIWVPRSDDPEEDNLCQERWKNMSEEVTAKMWGIFDEMGIFFALCRHGFVLLIADMVKSGELAKYGLAISDALLDAFGPDSGLGYDIGCGFETTIKNSPLGPKALRLNFKMLVGSFHGHAHNQMCQLRYLMTYVLGLGLEDLEGCERYFSKSNALSHVVRHASVYHRKQVIATYLAHTNTFETYTNLSLFLVNNYKQALEILDTEDSLKFAMNQAGISGDEFVRRLEEEKAYLKGLSKESEKETQQMEYYQKLVNLQAQRKTFDEVFAEGSTANGTAQRHARKNYDKTNATVQKTEKTMEITVQWTAGTNEWEAAALLVSTRQHIAKALQVWSKTIRAALARYNKVAAALTPKRCSLTWNEVVEYTFLSDFNVLRDPTGNVDLQEWATPAARQLMDTFFRIQRAKEEIPWLNIEIRRLVTYIHEKRIFLLQKEAKVAQTDPHLAYFIQKYCNRRGCSDATHMARLHVMEKKLGIQFTGMLTPGVRQTEVQEPALEANKQDEMEVDSEAEEAEAVAVAAEISRGRESERNAQPEDEWEAMDSNEEDEGEVAEAETLAEMTERVLTIAMDE